MSSKSRTIDNLGVDTSSRYARDKAALDTSIVKESQFIPLKTAVSVVRPYIATEFEEYVADTPLTLWASFSPPPDYLSYAKALFTYQTVPSLGDFEQFEKTVAMLESLGETLDREDSERKDKEKERRILLNLIRLVSVLDRSLALINAQRNRYQKG